MEYILSQSSKPVDLALLRGYSVIQGSPNSTYGKKLFDRQIENYGQIANRSRKEINYHYLNDTIIGAIIRAIVAGVVGKGINIQCRTANSFINDSYEAYLKEFAEAENFEVTGRWDMDEAWSQALTFLKLQGGVIVRHHYNASWEIPYRVEFVGIDKIDTSKTIREENVLNGIKKDKYGRVIGLYLHDDDLNYSIQSTLHDMENMIYYIEGWTSLSQYTAISRFVTILQKIDGTSEYSVAEIKAAIDRSKNNIFWHTELSTKMQQIVQDILQKETGAEGQAEELYKIASQIAANKGNGFDGVRVTPQADKISVASNGSSSVYESLMGDSQMNMSASMGTSQISAFKDIGKGNFSSIKMATALDDRELEIDFVRLTTRIVKPILYRFFEVAIQMQKILKKKILKKDEDGNIIETKKIPLTHEEYFNNPDKKEIYHRIETTRTSKTAMSEKDQSVANRNDLSSGAGLISKVYTQKDGSDYFEDKIADTIVRSKIAIREAEIAIKTEEAISEMWGKSSVERPIEDKQEIESNEETKDEEE